MNKPSLSFEATSPARPDPDAGAVSATVFGRVQWGACAAKVLGVLCVAAILSGLPLRQAIAQTTVNIADVPLLALKSAPGLVMLTMSRDHRLFYSAYNDASDLNGDGVPDVGFKPSI